MRRKERTKEVKKEGSKLAKEGRKEGRGETGLHEVPSNGAAHAPVVHRNDVLLCLTVEKEGKDKNYRRKKRVRAREKERHPRHPR